MKVFYDEAYNIDVGIMNFLHPFDVRKFGKVAGALKVVDGASVESPCGLVPDGDIDAFVDPLLRLLIRKKRYIFRALEIPYLPIIPLSLIDKRVLLPMRWGVAGTIEAAKAAIRGDGCWNLSGGYHHASRASAEGFCIYNDIGIATDVLVRDGLLADDARILVVDVDAHHGNGNARVFMESNNVSILDIYNRCIYPSSDYTRGRVNISIPLDAGTGGVVYLEKLEAGLDKLDGGYDLAFVVAGTDVLAADPLGGLGLSIEDCVKRDVLVYEKLRSISTPMVFLGGGGYSRDSASAMLGSLKALGRA